VEWKVLLCFLFVTEIWDVGLIRLKSPSCFGRWICLHLQMEGEKVLCWASWKELVTLLTCSECWSYIHENIHVFSARRHVTYLGAVYENFAFFSVIWLESIMCTACSFFILHTLLFWIELIPVVFIIYHCNSDHAHYRIFLSFLSSYAFWLIHQASMHICALSEYLPCFLIAF